MSGEEKDDVVLQAINLAKEHLLDSQVKNISKELSSSHLEKEFTSEESEAEPADIRAKLSKMSIALKLKSALLGNSTVRGILIYDSNRLIQEAVLKNPRLQIREVENFAQNPNTSDWVLRKISENKQWISIYQIKASLVFNPKTPLSISQRLLPYLREHDLRKIARTKNLSSTLISLARKRLAKKG